MKSNNCLVAFFVLGVLLHFPACVIPAEKPAGADDDVSRYVDDVPFGRKSGGRERFGREFGGKSTNFKVPVPPGYDWEVTQSWAEHCDLCNAKGYDWDYCADSMSHNLDCCKYSWDFNLPGVSDVLVPQDIDQPAPHLVNGILRPRRRHTQHRHTSHHECDQDLARHHHASCAVKLSTGRSTPPSRRAPTRTPAA